MRPITLPKALTWVLTACWRRPKSFRLLLWWVHAQPCADCTETEAGALIGVPARKVPVNMGDVDPDAFTVDPAGLKRLNNIIDPYIFSLPRLFL